VTAITSRARVIAPIVLCLFATSLALLVAGHFFSWNDTQGFQYERWNYTDGDLAAVTALLGGVISLADRTARRVAGAVTAAFVVLLVVLELVAPHFAFAGNNDAFGLAGWEIPLSIVAFVLLTPRWLKPGWRARRRLTTWARFDLYLVLMVTVVPYVIAVVTWRLFTTGHPECNEGGDACLEAYAAWFYALAIWAGLVVLIGVVEAVVAGRALHRRWRRA
jgi:hypothetical protein